MCSKSKTTKKTNGRFILIIYILDDLDFHGYNEVTRADEKSIYLVDSGLSFNIPFPILLRYYLILWWEKTFNCFSSIYFLQLEKFSYFKKIAIEF